MPWRGMRQGARDGRLAARLSPSEHITRAAV